MKTYRYVIVTTEGEVIVDMDDDGIFTDDTGEVYFEEDFTQISIT